MVGRNNNCFSFSYWILFFSEEAEMKPKDKKTLSSFIIDLFFIRGKTRMKVNFTGAVS